MFAAAPCPVAEGEKTFFAVIVNADAFSYSVARTDSYKHQVAELVIGASGAETQTLWRDLSEVTQGTAQEFHSIMLQQLETLKVKTWRSTIPPACFGLCVFVGDEGPDVEAGVGLIKEEVKGKPNWAIMRIRCFMHGVSPQKKNHYNITKS